MERTGGVQGPYESAIAAMVSSVTDWWPEPRRQMAVGCPIWVADRLSEETGAPLKAAPGDECELRLGDLRVFGARRLSGATGGFVVQDLRSGWGYRIPLRCHRDLPPSAWSSFTTALADGLTVPAAVEVVGLLNAV